MKSFRCLSLILALPSAVFLLGGCTGIDSANSAAAPTAPSTAAVSWDSVPAILARIKPPTFPNRDFPITNYGAQAGGSVDSTDALRQAIAACNAAGGGRVVVPAGVFLTGAIHLKSNVNLYVSAGATLRFSTDPNAYLPVVRTRWEGVEVMNYSPFIYAFEQENIAVTGPGTLDGGAALENWWGWAKKGDAKTTRATADVLALTALAERKVPVAERVFGAGHFLRPAFFQPYLCKNILVEDVTILRSPMWEITPVLSSNITVRGLKIDTHGPNNDGCNPDSCRDVLIENCVFDTGDDCIAIKSGRNDDGRRVGVPSENIVIRNCAMKDGHGGVVIGSEISGDCRNVFVENCVMDSPHLERALRFKSNARRGGIVENIFMRNVTVGQVAEAILTIDFMYEEGAKGEHMPTVRHVVMENITSKNSPRVFYVTSFQGATIDDILIRNCTFAGITSSELIQNAGRITLDHVNIVPAKKTASLSTRDGPP